MNPYEAPLKTVSLCGVTFRVEGEQVIAEVGDWAFSPGRATIPCAKARLVDLLRVINYATVEERPD